MIFWLVCGICILIALAFVLPPLLQSNPQAVADESDVAGGNLSIYKDQLEELDADLRNGLISTQQYQQDRDEINRRVLEDASFQPKKQKVKQVPAARGPAYAVALALPILAVGLYYKLGNLNAPSAEQQPVQSEAPA